MKVALDIQINFTITGGNTYYFGDDGALYVNKFYTNWGNTYYFGEEGIRYTDQFYTNWGNTYYYGDDGALYVNRFYNNWGNTYYFGEEGIRYTNQFYTNWGNIYYFGSDGELYVNRNLNIGESNYLVFNQDGVMIFNDPSLSSYQNEFMNDILYGVILSWKDYNVLPSLTAAQAILESGWGQSSLSAKYNNLFGIKGDYNGNTVLVPTQEYYNDSYVTVNDCFRVYTSKSQSVLDHNEFLVNNSRYSNLIGISDSNMVTDLIRKDGYATSPTYTDSLRKVIASYNLTALDKVGFEV